MNHICSYKISFICFWFLVNRFSVALIATGDFEKLAADGNLEEAARSICPIFTSKDACVPYLTEVSSFDDLLIEPIGQGGLANVFMVNNDYVVKTFSPKSKALHFAVLREIHMSLLIFSSNHSNLMPIQKCCIEANDSKNPLDSHYFARMELMRYQDLGKILGRDDSKGLLKRFDWKYRLLMGMTKALFVLHQNGFVHRDIKPENILMRSAYIPVLADFNGSYNSWYGSPGEGIFGTPGYIPPEVIDSSSYGYAVDIFALGKVFFQVMNAVSFRNTRIGLIDIPNHCKASHSHQAFSLLALELQFYCQYLEPLVLSMISESPEDRPEISVVQVTLEALLPYFQNIHLSILRLKDILRTEETTSFSDPMYMQLISQANQPIMLEISADQPAEIGGTGRVSFGINDLNKRFEAMSIKGKNKLI